MDTRSITGLELRQYKSVERCNIELSPLTILVGRNGVGKSNIIDSVRFVAEGLGNTLEFAIRERGGIDQVRRKSLGGRPTHPHIGLRVALGAARKAHYSFRIAAVQGRGFRVDRERCTIFGGRGEVLHEYEVNDGAVRWSLKTAPPAATADRLFLVAASGNTEFRPLYDTLTRMTFHNLNPEAMKYPQRPEPGLLLSHDGRNLSSVIKQLQGSAPAALERVAGYLRAIGVPISRINHKPAGPLETIEVAQEMQVPEGTRNSTFDAIALSDGTIRALGILVSLVSAQGASGAGPSLVGIEEPETALHPAAAGALMDALIEGSASTQLLLTCHSPDLLDHDAVTPSMIRPVLLENGRTVVGALSPAKGDLLKKHLLTAGDLLRLDQLEPDPDDLRQQAEGKNSLFEQPA